MPKKSYNARSNGLGLIRPAFIAAWSAPLIPRDRLDREIRQLTGKIRDLGVEHKDIRPQNMLWNVEVGRVLLIDFERSCASHPSNHQKRSSLRTEVLREVSSKPKHS
jgi:Ser/Thr protein kinase RdoA (MazF antagonist)